MKQDGFFYFDIDTFVHYSKKVNIGCYHLIIIEIVDKFFFSGILVLFYVKENGKIKVIQFYFLPCQPYLYLNNVETTFYSTFWFDWLIWHVKNIKKW